MRGKGLFLKNLIIVESPTKAKTISNFLSRNYKVLATKGHIRDLPDKRFGIEISEESGEIIPKYSISRDNQKKLKDIKEYAKKAENIFLATDEDREGEAIGFHTAIALKENPEEIPRIVFHEITKDAILKALKNPRKIDMKLVNAQQTRRVLDRMVGYKLSPLLSSKIQRGLSAGRVQSSTLKIIVEREREIKAFKPVEYWQIPTIFRKDLDSTLTKFHDEKIEKLSIQNEERATEIYNSILKDNFVVTKIEEKERNISPQPPFMTSTLQQTASSKLGFSPKKTMMLAQKLYEGVELPDGKKSGLITYMRTDSLNLAEEATDKAVSIIKEKLGDKFADKPRKYKSKSKGAQEAHEAIRPTILDLKPEDLKGLHEDDLIKLYKLIYNRFFASQTANAVFQNQNVTIIGEESEFKLSGRKMLFKGFYAYTDLDDGDRILPHFKIGEKMTLQKVEKEQKFTEPPSRFSEAGLVKNLEALGIGRPSTYAPTISTLVARKYIQIDKKRLMPTEIAEVVTELLEEHFPNIVDQNFTANMENTLDLIAEKDGDWQKILKDFYLPFLKDVENGKENIKSQKEAIPIGRNCPDCDSELLRRKGRFGEFIACSSFPKCRYSENADGVPNKKREKVFSDEVCILCGKQMEIKDGKNGKFLACSGYPKCKYSRPIKFEFVKNLTCPECGKQIVIHNHLKTPIFRCEDYPKCKFSTKFQPTENKKCNKCGYRVAEREYRGKKVTECLKCKNREEIN
jgi:DNA topoisomerase-1